jgi:hypothetical protein
MERVNRKIHMSKKSTVSILPADVTAPVTLDTPGTTTTLTPASTSARTSSAPRPYRNGSPVLSRTTARPREAYETSKEWMDSYRVQFIPMAIVHIQEAEREKDGERWRKRVEREGVRQKIKIKRRGTYLFLKRRCRLLRRVNNLPIHTPHGAQKTLRHYTIAQNNIARRQETVAREREEVRRAWTAPD